MRPGTRHEVVVGLTVALALWGILLFFENAYFAAPAFGVDPPIWSAWVAVLPFWSLNVIDTVALIALIALVLLARTPKARKMGSRGSSSVGAVVGWLVILAVVAIVAFALFGFTLPDALRDLCGFLGAHC